jgi:arylsulfatase I/J
MALYMDDTVGVLVQAMKDKGMWENTLLVFMADNGGPMYEPGGSSNYPLKGGKYNDFQGGVRTNAFMSGGFIPESMRGTEFSGIISVADWYSTFSEIAGVDAKDEKSEAANDWLMAQRLPSLPPVDSVPQWGFIANNTNARPGLVHLSDTAVLRWPYKLVIGVQPYGRHSGELYPNCSTVDGMNNDHGPQFVDLKIFDHTIDLAIRAKKEQEIYWQEDCGEGCLYNLEEDPNEHTNIAGVATDVFEQMKVSLAELNEDLFLPDRGDASVEACQTALDQGSFMGPFVDTDGWYSPPPQKSMKQRVKDARRSVQYSILGIPVVKGTIENVVQAVMPLMRPITTRTSGLDSCRGADLLV